MRNRVVLPSYTIYSVRTITPKTAKYGKRRQKTAKDDKRRQKTLFIENIYAACDEIKLNAQIALLLLTLHRPIIHRESVTHVLCAATLVFKNSQDCAPKIPKLKLKFPS